MKSLFGVVLICLAGVAFSPSIADPQSLGLSLTSTFDPSTGSAYAYGETTSDYATGYYYDLCTYLDAQGEEDDGNWDYYETAGNCGSTDAEVSWSFTTDGTTDFVQFNGQNVEYIDYYVYQMDEFCGGDGYDCGDYWDAFEDSLLAGDSAGGGASYTLYGPPAIGYYVAQISQTTVQYGGTYCYYPYTESTAYSGAQNTGYYEALFSMTLITYTPFVSYTGRWTGEALSGLYWNCTSVPPGGSLYAPPSYPTAATWQASGTSYGPDAIATDVGQVNYYQGFLSGSQSCTTYGATQQMSMQTCRGSVWVPYGTGHDIHFQVYSSAASGFRQGVSGAAQ